MIMKVAPIFLLLFSVFTNSQNLPTVYAEGGVKYYDYVAEERDEIIEYGVYLGFGTCLGTIDAEVSASSFLKSQGSNSYSPTNMRDMNPLTAWVEGESGYGIGQEITFEGGIPNMILNGYQKSINSYYNNSRVKTFKVSYNGRALCYLQLKDLMGEQRFDLPINAYEGYIVFEIIEVYPGKKWKDTAISQFNTRGCCFATDTTIGLETLKTIEQLDKSQRIDIIDEDLNKLDTANVLGYYEINHSRLIEISTKEYSIKVTPDHPMFFENYGFTSLTKILLKEKLSSYKDLLGDLNVMVWDKDKKETAFVTITQLKEMRGDFKTYTITKLSKGKNYFANGFLQRVYVN